MKFLSERRGQSTVEFIITFSLTFGIVGLMLNLAKTYTMGYLVHWATFQSGRAYLVHEVHSNSVSAEVSRLSSPVQTIFYHYPLKSVPGLFSPNQDFRRSGLPYYVLGPSFKFSSSFSFLPGVTGSKSVELVSEGFLGKEPLRQECLDRICLRLSQLLGLSTCDALNMIFYDNGC